LDDGPVGAEDLTSIVIVAEGETEEALLPALRAYVIEKSGRSPKLKCLRMDGTVFERSKLLRLVDLTLREFDHVIVLTDQYSGTPAKNFESPEIARRELRKLVGNRSNVHVHVAAHDFEAWLIPLWDEIASSIGSKKQAPSGSPEKLNNQNPPSKRIAELFRSAGRKYIKTRDAKKYLEKHGLKKSVDACPELKAMVDTILALCAEG